MKILMVCLGNICRSPLAEGLLASKLPKDKFTRYGADATRYNLRYWYLTPAIFDKTWKIYSNLDMDDLYVDNTDYNITFIVPKSYILNSDIFSSFKYNGENKEYILIGNNKSDIELNITLENDFFEFQSNPVNILTNLTTEKLNAQVQTDIITRELLFLKSYLGDFPHALFYKGQLSEFKKMPVENLWVLEILIKHPEKEFGAFIEDILI